MVGMAGLVFLASCLGVAHGVALPRSAMRAGAMGRAAVAMSPAAGDTRSPRRSPSSKDAGRGGPPGGAPRGRSGGGGGGGKRQPEREDAAETNAYLLEALPAELHYVPERQMYSLFCAAAVSSGLDERNAGVLTRTRAPRASGAPAERQWRAATVRAGVVWYRHALSRPAIRTHRSPPVPLPLARRDAARSARLPGVAINMYSLGCGYHPDVVRRVLKVVKPGVARGERWAVVLSKVINRELPKLRGTCLPITPDEAVWYEYAEWHEYEGDDLT